MKILSKSVIFMFLFDLLFFIVATFFSGYVLGMYIKVVAVASLFIVTTGLISAYLKGYYRIREYNPTVWNFYRLFEGVVFSHVPAAIVLFFFLNKLILIKFICLNIVFVYIGLLVYRICFHYYLFHFKKTRNVIIIGSDQRARVIADEIQGKYALKMNVVGFIKNKNEQDDNEIVQDNKIPVYNSQDSLKDIIEQYSVDIIVISQPNEIILQIPKWIKIYKMPDFYEMVTGKYYIDNETITDLYYHYLIHRSLFYDFCKRAYDIIAASIILIVTLPITGFTAIRIWLTDKENPIYTQTRIGIDGKKFKCYKLRTMYANNYIPKNLNHGGYAENQEVDDRVIPWCKFVRKARFDEIPQMINILKGEMSIVGPRAEWDDIVDIYKTQIPFYSCRTWIKTGWTGWAQINQGHCINIDDATEKLQYDLFYLKNRNIVWEIFILVKAIFLALGGRHG